MLLHVLRAMRDFFVRGHSDLRADGKARGPHINMLEGKQNHTLPSKHKISFYHMLVFCQFSLF